MTQYVLFVFSNFINVSIYFFKTIYTTVIVILLVQTK